VRRTHLNQSSKAFCNGGLSNFQKSSHNEWEAAALGNPEGCLTHVFVGFFAPAAVSHHQHCLYVCLAHFTLRYLWPDMRKDHARIFCTGGEIADGYFQLLSRVQK
jgi:hypothetical protein